MENSLKFSDFFNIILGVFSVLGIISGFLIEEFRLTFWAISIVVLSVVVIISYLAENKKSINFLFNKMNKMEESLNIYERLNKLEIAMKMKKKGEMDLLDIVKILLALLLIYVLYIAIKSQF